MRHALVLCALSLVVGCADPCADLGAAGLELGTSDATGVDFVPISDGQEVTLYPGIQGGAHVWLHARLTGLCPTRAAFDRRVVDARTDELVTIQRGPVEFVPRSTGGFELERPVQMSLCPDPFGRALDGAALRFVVTAEERGGPRTDAQVGFVASCDGVAACETFCR